MSLSSLISDSLSSSQRSQLEIISDDASRLHEVLKHYIKTNLNCETFKDASEAIQKMSQIRQMIFYQELNCNLNDQFGNVRVLMITNNGLLIGVNETRLDLFGNRALAELNGHLSFELSRKLNDHSSSSELSRIQIVLKDTTSLTRVKTKRQVKKEKKWSYQR